MGEEYKKELSIEDVIASARAMPNQQLLSKIVDYENKLLSALKTGERIDKSLLSQYGVYLSEASFRSTLDPKFAEKLYSARKGYHHTKEYALLNVAVAAVAFQNNAMHMEDFVCALGECKIAYNVSSISEIELARTALPVEILNYLDSWEKIAKRACDDYYKKLGEKTSKIEEVKGAEYGKKYRNLIEYLFLNILPFTNSDLAKITSEIERSDLDPEDKLHLINTVKEYKSSNKTLIMNYENTAKVVQKIWYTPLSAQQIQQIQMVHAMRMMQNKKEEDDNIRKNIIEGFEDERLRTEIELIRHRYYQPCA